MAARYARRPGIDVRFLFLDIDGVLNRTGYRPAVADGLASWIEPELADNLVQLLARSGARVVVSSDWRIGRDAEELARHLAHAGAAVDVHDVTPVLAGAPRWREIEAWCEAHAIEPARIVILDDMFDMGELAARHVRVSPLTGLSTDVARAALRLWDLA